VKRFKERNKIVLAGVGSLLLILAVLAAVNFSRLPFVSNEATYQAHFADSAGLQRGDPVSVAGVDVGNVSGLALDGAQVLVTFTVQQGIPLGNATSVSAKVLTPLGQEYLAVSPSGFGSLGSAVIPESRTHETQTLVSTVTQLGNQAGQINVSQLVNAFTQTSQGLEAISPAQTRQLLSGLASLSQVISTRQDKIAGLLSELSTVSGTVAQHTSQIVSLLGQGDLLLQVLNQRHQAIDQLLKSTASLTSTLDQLFASHQSEVGPLLTDLNTVSNVLAKDGNDLAAAIPLLASANKYLANASGSGAFGDFVLPAGLIPDNFIKQCEAPGAINPLTGCNP
jgi:phospholipid/cholesterol/gamma-HCH transport system substrate-binding protein